MAILHVWDDEGCDEPLELVCQYCNKLAEPITGERLYPHRFDLWHKRFYRCEPCGAHVGCHGASWTPLGVLANAELRKAKMLAHEALDPLWRSGQMSRSAVYGWLANQLNISADRCHIGQFDVATCQRVVNLVLTKLGG